MLVGALVWPCPAPDPCTVSCPFLFSNCSAQPVRSAGVNQETCLHMCVCECACVRVCAWGTWKPGDSGASYWIGWVSKACYWLSSWSAREGKMMRPLVSFMFMRVLCFLSVLILVVRCVYLYICVLYVCLRVCLLGRCTQLHFWLNLGRESCRSLVSIRLLNSATPNKKTKPKDKFHKHQDVVVLFMVNLKLMFRNTYIWISSWLCRKKWVLHFPPRYLHYIIKRYDEKENSSTCP